MTENESYPRLPSREEREAERFRIHKQLLNDTTKNKNQE